jgi:hypothetical protein
MRIKGDGLEASSDVLRANGNMSSATIFFVLQQVLSTTSRSDVFTAGFGPGLTVEFGRLHRVSTRGGAATAAADAASEGSDAEELDGGASESSEEADSAATTPKAAAAAARA